MAVDTPPFRCSVAFREYAAPARAWDDLGREVKASAKFRRGIVRAIKRDHSYLERRLLGTFCRPARTRSEIYANRHALPQYITDKIAPFVVYVARYFETADNVWLYLYAGETLRLLEGSTCEIATTRQQEIDTLLQQQRRLFARFFERRIGPDARRLFQRVQNAIEQLIVKRAQKELRVLLVGDCLFSDVVDFLRPKCVDDGISVIPVRIASKHPAETCQQLIECSKEKFDAVFWSPFTYENVREYAHLLSWKARGLKGHALTELVDEIIHQIRATAEVLTKNYECSVFIHNCGGFRRWDSNIIAAVIKSVATRGPRRTARDAINLWLQNYVEDKNAATFDHLFIIDEQALVEEVGERRVAKYIFDSGDLHTAVFGRILADFYRDIIFALAHLREKKLVVSDLDNTLWHGTIGETSVSPFLDRQALLQGLKKKGVLLAACSKNNPRDISWQKNLLGSSDFVAARINWESKPQNLQSIERELKLKRKDFVFIDDSQLERELVGAEFPEVLVLNPDEPRTWRLLRVWRSLLGRGSVEDRTTFYLNEKERSRILELDDQRAGNLGQALSKLRIKVKIRAAQTSDLKRAVELVNRTNQFNLCGTRTSFREMQAWLNSADYKISIGEAEDKFGSMGTVCVAVSHFASETVHIPVFVLSCRVIGYGIESAMLNYLCLNARAAGAKSVVGHMRFTPHNDPCRSMYANSGFADQGDGRWQSNALQVEVAPWLTIDRGVWQSTATA